MSLTFGPVAKGCAKSRAPACAGRDWRRDSLHPASSSSSCCCWGSPGTPRPPQPAAGLHVGSLPNEALASLSACFSKLGLITSSLTFLIRAGAEHGRRRPAPVPSSPPSGERRFFPLITDSRWFFVPAPSCSQEELLPQPWGGKENPTAARPREKPAPQRPGDAVSCGRSQPGRAPAGPRRRAAPSRGGPCCSGVSGIKSYS